MSTQTIQTEVATNHILTVNDHDVERYERYMQNVVAPKNAEDRFRRFLFAFASVHTSWKSNCRMYLSLHELNWLHDSEALKQRIIESGAGLHNNRTAFIYEFSEFYWAHPLWFNKSKYETWVHYRDRLAEQVKGLGFAKAAFTTELLYPTTCQVLCTDVHILKLYGLTAGKARDKDLYAIEKHWTDLCLTRNMSAAVARWLYWDKQAQHSDSRFWTWVFEPLDYNKVLAELSDTPISTAI